MASTLAGFVGSTSCRQQQTKYGMRPVTTLQIGVRDKDTKQVAWNFVNVFGTPPVEKGDIVQVAEVKTYGRTRYGKLAGHEARNRRDRQPQQLALGL
jgi:hypothetical protein